MSQAQSPITSLKTVGTFMKRGACSETLLAVLDGAYGHPMPDEESATQPLAGGILQHGYQCGMIWGAALAAGAQAHRLFGAGPEAEAKAIAAARRVVDSFRELNDATNCVDITGLDKNATTLKLVKVFLLQGPTVGCFRMAARYAPVASSAVDAALAEPSVEPPAPPVSCAATLARAMGASDEHATMAAGLAGGIGLCGGACGALGTAIWLTELERKKDGGKVVYKSPEALELVERVLKATGGELECRAIVGRTFDGVADHAAWLRGGGCAKVLDALARVRAEAPDAPVAAPEAVAVDGVELGPDGHLADPKQWTRELGERIASALGVEMDEARWKLVDVARSDFDQTGAAPNVRRLTQIAGVGTKELYARFPHAPARTIAKIGGLPKPAGCI